MVDVILMVALADGSISQDTLDRIARTIQSHTELEGVDWEWVNERCAELDLDAPLFSDARKRLKKQITRDESRRLAISLAAKIVSAEHPLSEEQLAILGTIAEGFEIGEQETHDLLLPWETADVAAGYVRSRCNDPDDARAPPLFDALAQARRDDEIRLLMYKLCAARRVADKHIEGGRITKVGEPIQVGPYTYKADAVLETETGRWVLRCLFEGEALHLGEHEILASLQPRLGESSGVFIAHMGEISPPDDAFLKGLDQTKLRIEKIEI